VYVHALLKNRGAQQKGVGGCNYLIINYGIGLHKIAEINVVHAVEAK
jgi:hypothetical protein